jgi:hypothetical protein
MGGDLTTAQYTGVLAQIKRTEMYRIAPPRDFCVGLRTFVGI